MTGQAEFKHLWVLFPPYEQGLSTNKYVEFYKMGNKNNN